MRYERSNAIAVGSGYADFWPNGIVVDGTGAAKVQFAHSSGANIGVSDVSFVKSCKIAAIAATLASSATAFASEALGSLPVVEVSAVELRRVLSEAGVHEPATTNGRTSLVNIDPILASLEVESVEDGVVHPGERQVALFVETHSAGALEEALMQRLDFDPRAAALFTLVGRMDGLSTASQERLLTAALSSTNVQIRDAAAQAAELWDKPSLAAILRAHREPVPWLADYMEHVAVQMTR